MTDIVSLRIAMGHRCIEIFKEQLTPHQWGQCASGQDDPDSFLDSNIVVADAYQEIFGYDPDSALCSDREDEVSSNWNAAVRLASQLMIGDTINDEQAAEIVSEDDPVGLGVVGGGRNLREVAREFGLIR